MDGWETVMNVQIVRMGVANGFGDVGCIDVLDPTLDPIERCSWLTPTLGREAGVVDVQVSDGDIDVEMRITPDSLFRGNRTPIFGVRNCWCGQHHTGRNAAEEFVVEPTGYTDRADFTILRTCNGTAQPREYVARMYQGAFSDPAVERRCASTADALSAIVDMIREAGWL